VPTIGNREQRLHECRCVKRLALIPLSVGVALLSLDVGAQVSSSVMSASTSTSAPSASPAPPTNPTLPTVEVTPTSPTTTVVTESVGGFGTPSQVGTLTTTINFTPPSTAQGFSGVIAGPPALPVGGTGIGTAVTSGSTTSLGPTAGVGPGASPFVSVPGLPPGVTP
jgi:hypothetical protein